MFNFIGDYCLFIPPAAALLFMAVIGFVSAEEALSGR